MIFNPDLSKQAQEVTFSRKTNKISHPTTSFNTVPVACTSCQKHLGLYFDEKLNFTQHINIKISKARELESLKGFHIFFQEIPLQLSTNLSLDHILITVMLYMTNQTMKVFVPKLNEYSTMLPFLLLVQ